MLTFLPWNFPPSEILNSEGSRWDCYFLSTPAWRVQLKCITRDCWGRDAWWHIAALLQLETSAAERWWLAKSGPQLMAGKMCSHHPFLDRTSKTTQSNLSAFGIRLVPQSRAKFKTGIFCAGWFFCFFFASWGDTQSVCPLAGNLLLVTLRWEFSCLVPRSGVCFVSFKHTETFSQKNSQPLP